MARKNELQTKVMAETQVAVIVSQVLVAAAIAIPLGLFAAAIGVLSARSQTGQVRIAVTMSTPTPTPTVSPTPTVTPSPVVPIRVTNFMVKSISADTASFTWNNVAGADAYVLYGNGRWLTVFSPYEYLWQPSYSLNYLSTYFAPGTSIYFQVAPLFMGGGGEGEKTGAPPVTTPTKKHKCEKEKDVEKSGVKAANTCTERDKKWACVDLLEAAANEAAGWTCSTPCKAYNLPEPPKEETDCKETNPKAADLVRRWTGGYFELMKYIISCKVTVKLLCRIDGNVPEGAVSLSTGTPP